MIHIKVRKEINYSDWNDLLSNSGNKKNAFNIYYNRMDSYKRKIIRRLRC